MTKDKIPKDDFFYEDGGIKTGGDFLYALLRCPNVTHIKKKFEDVTLDDIIEPEEKKIK